MAMEEAVIENGWVVLWAIHANHIHENGARRASPQGWRTASQVKYFFKHLTGVSTKNKNAVRAVRGVCWT